MKKYVKNVYSIGIDLDLNNVNSCKGKYDDVILADVRYLPLREGSVDVSACVDVLELIRERKEALEEIKRITKKRIYFHFFNGKYIPMKQTIQEFGKVKYFDIRLNEFEDSYKSKYRRLKEERDKILRIAKKEIEDRAIVEMLEKIYSNHPKVYLGSYIIYVDLNKV